jgi:hypothetical protein
MPSSSLESIAFRTVLAVSVIAVVAGLPTMYLAKQNGDSWWESYRQETAKDESRELDECRKVAVLNDDAEAVKLCYQMHGSNIELMNLRSQRANQAYELSHRALATAVLVPLGAFSAFILLRWILTGRWRRVRVPKTPAV